MEIQEHRHGAVVVLKPLGPLCLNDAEIFRQRIFEVMAKSRGHFVIDVSAVPYIDSQGLEAMVDTSEVLSQSGQSFKVCTVNNTLHEVLALTGFASHFESYEKVTDAVRSFL